MQNQRRNRLAGESSPYLLQHAHNPVDWYPWGLEAFERARKENKPIFLSVGYSSCYWCHVMERESFENEATAADLNRDFVCIKVDREERPDVDQLYMTAVQLMTHSGGWPMSVFLTPGPLRPFYGGTYFPPKDMAGRPGFTSLLRSIADAWAGRRQEVEQAADSLAAALARYSLPTGAEVPLTIDAAFIDNLIGRSISDYDREHGGFGGAPKFPRETLLELLLAYCEAEPVGTEAKESVRDMLGHTLEKMARGGIRDQLGGGFHRYSTDERWLVPHFEIMLYDNAMLLGVYARAARLLDREDFAQVARRIAAFVLREMTGPEGEFYTAFDAEVDGREGATYLWTREQIAQVLTEQEAAIFNAAYGMDKGPNFADPHHGNGVAEANVLHLPKPLTQIAERLGVLPADVESELTGAREKLLAARRKRKQPMLDTKVLTSWNAMMIEALALAGRLLEAPAYIEAAARAMEFLLKRHRTADLGLWRASREGRPSIAGFVDDYACVMAALLGLHAATGESKWLVEAQAVREQMLRRFLSPVGALYFTDAGAQELFVRQIVGTDSPLPAGNAVAALAMLQMGEGELPRRIISAFAEAMDTQGEAYATMVMAAMKYVATYGPIEVPATAMTGELAAVKANAEEAVTASAKLVGENHAELRIGIAAGYHINTSEALAGLYATRVVVGQGAARVEYPPANSTLALPDGGTAGAYEGTITIHVRSDEPLKGRAIMLYVQPCSAVACLGQMRIALSL